MIQIAADLGERALSKILSEDGRWHVLQRSLLVAEGLFLYLKDEEVHDLLSEAAACTASGSRILFTHKLPDERKIIPMALRLIGEPFQSAVRSEDLPEYIQGTGWTIISEIDSDPAHGIERYAVAERR
jgi:O-methyltransferase involved in polyketide biosynthesis